MAFHVDVALQIEHVAHVPDDFAKAAMEHRGGGSAAYVEGGDRLVAYDIRIEVHFCLDGVDVSLREIASV